RAEAAEHHVVPLGPLAGVPLEALAFEVLHRVLDAGVRVDLPELLADRHAVDGQAAELLPVGAEATAEIVAGRFEVDAPLDRLGGREGLLTASIDRQLVPQEAELHVEALRPGPRMPLEACPLEPLGHPPGGRIHELVGDRKPVHGEAADLPPVRPEPAAEAASRLRIEGAVRLRLR